MAEPVLLPFDRPLLLGKLIRRDKRFLADVSLDSGGQTVTVHVPNTGSMLTCGEPGSQIALAGKRENFVILFITWDYF